MAETKQARIVGYYFDKDDLLKVPSRRNQGVYYTVTAETCNCPAGTFSSNACWHRHLREKIRDDIVAGMVVAGVSPEGIMEEIGGKFPELLDMPNQYWELS